MNTQEKYELWLNSKKVSKITKEVLKRYTKVDIDDAFFKDIEFGTAGMRGIIGPGTNRMNEFTLKKATVGFGKYLLEKFPNASEMGVVISHDNRHLSREFTLQTAEILSQMGIKAYIFDSLRPTPELSYAVRFTKACGGIMITASHNPKEYNGYKVYDETGCQLIPDKILRLLEIIDSLPDYLDVEVPFAKLTSPIITLGNIVDDTYVKLVEDIQINKNLNKDNFKIIYTPQHGTSFVNGMRIFKDLGYNIIPVMSQCSPDPDFSNTLTPNPEDPKAYIAAIELAKEVDGDLIIMTDPDGDRCGLAYKSKEGKYNLLTGNQSAALLINYILSQRLLTNSLPKDGVLYDTIVTSSLGRDIALSYKLKCESFLTGFKFIGSRIDYYEKHGGPTFVFGYEESYGCLVSPFVRDKDGLQAILLYSEMAVFYSNQGKRLDEVYDELQKKFGYRGDECYSIFFKGSEGLKEMNQLLLGLRNKPLTSIGGVNVVEIRDYLSQNIYRNGEIISKIDLPVADVIIYVLENGNTVSIRPSGTEPKCKFYIGVKANSSSEAEKAVAQTYAQLKKELGIKAS